MNADFIESRGDMLLAVVDLGVYPISALLKVAHKFTNRCYLHLQIVEGAKVEVRFRSKVRGRDCSDVAGEFLNELLDQTLREQIGRESEPIRNLILAHALSNTALIRPDLEEADPFAETVNGS